MNKSVHYSKILQLLRYCLVTMLTCTASCEIYVTMTAVVVRFSQSDFAYYTDSSGKLSVICKKPDCSYPGVGLPVIPLINKNYLLKSNQEYVNTTVTYKSKMVRAGVTMATCSDVVPTNSTEPVAAPSPVSIHTALFPETVWEMRGITKLNECDMLQYVLSPYVYDARTKVLTFITEITLNIETRIKQVGEGDYSNQSSPYIINPELYHDFVINNNRLDEIKIERDSLNPIDYLLITCDSLVESFKPLLDWKRVKGLHVATETIENIYRNYDGVDLVHKIKKCINRYLARNGVRYVALGGDEKIVPPRYCYIVIGKNTEKGYVEYKEHIPTDKYYACMGGDFNWDGDGDKIYGEPEDNINLLESVFVARIPVQTKQDARNVALKFVDSEMNPMWNGTLLMSGVTTQDTIMNGKSDSELKAENMYYNYFEPYFHIPMKKFFDTGTDFPGGASYDVTATNYLTQLNKGYSFIEYIGHGGIDCFLMENGPYFSGRHHSSRINSNLNTGIITTGACLTNSFDSDEEEDGPSLSEALIRNINSGIVGYCGCSRLNWEHNTFIDCLEHNLSYDAAFYTKLYSSKLKDKNFGKVVSLAKQSRNAWVIPNSDDSEISKEYCKYERWVHYGYNPIGDPEMPLFTETPKEFSNASVEVGLKSPILGSVVQMQTVIDAGEDNYRICISSEDDAGQRVHEVYEDVRRVVIDGSRFNCIATITKQNFKPKQLYAYYKQATEMPVGDNTGKILSCASDPGTNNLALELSIPESAKDVQIAVTDIQTGSTQLTTIENFLHVDSEKHQVDVKSGNGQYAVSLFVNGVINDSINIRK